MIQECPNVDFEGFEDEDFDGEFEYIVENIDMDSPEDLQSIDTTNCIRRKIIWDTMPCQMVEKVISKHGLMPSSPEGTDFEHKQSHRRLNTLGPISAPIVLTSTLAGDVVGKGILEVLGKIEGTAEYNRDLMVFQKVAQASSQAVIANLVEMGFLNIGTEGSLTE